MKLYRQGNHLALEIGGKVSHVSIDDVDIIEAGTDTVSVVVTNERGMRSSYLFTISEIETKKGETPYTTYQSVVDGILRGADVSVQDQTTPTVIIHMHKSFAQTTTTSQPAIGDYTVDVTSVAGVSIGDYVIFHDQATKRWMDAHIIGIATLTLTLDRQFDFAFPIGTKADYSDENLAVDGSVTPQIFGVRGIETGSNLDVEIDVTRLMFTCYTDTAVSLSEFGDIAILTRGLLFRTRDGKYNNIFNIKSNGELAGLCYDWSPYASSNPTQGQDGFVARLTFGGQSKIGVVVRLGAGDDLEAIVQDDLTSISRLEITIEGHVVQD